MKYTMCTACYKKGLYTILTPSCYGPANTTRCRYCGDVQQPQQQDPDEAGCVHPHHEQRYQSQLAWEREYYGLDD